MAVELLEAFTTDLLEHDHLVTLDVVLKDCCLYYSTLYIWSANLYCTLVIEKEHLVELYSLIFLCCETIYIKYGTSLNFELLSCDIYNCVHCLINS